MSSTISAHHPSNASACDSPDASPTNLSCNCAVANAAVAPGAWRACRLQRRELPESPLAASALATAQLQERLVGEASG
eukprot:CAMPEP_0182854978 /NCGR_PEP_ID=MMETSP0034_2-20130328/1575_1 /TAXON_ID=156128 /ORGANISM="Nephroselmis pyriformis, Strain CCMP717" /LENGTH=77 /DNA_ID=CAMNT_0024985877 /DNA_START=50 /DNA_END=280 /DNA_ORIENTATION=+